MSHEEATVDDLYSRVMPADMRTYGDCGYIRRDVTTYTPQRGVFVGHSDRLCDAQSAALRRALEHQIANAAF